MPHQSFPVQPSNFVIQTQIEGVEVTQALQYYRAVDHLTDPLDRGPDNSLLLVANKPAYVRVYLVYGLAAPSQYVTGELIVTRYHDGSPITWDAPTTLLPVSTQAYADPNATYGQRRSNSFQSLNFFLPAALMTGKLRIEARIRYSGISDNDVIDAHQIRVDATTIQFLPVRGIFITYNGPDGSGKPLTLAAPTMSQLQGLATDALAMFPVESTTRFSSAGGTTWTLPLNDQVGEFCSTNWDQLLARLATVRVIDGNRQDLLYYGVMPVGVPMSPVVGCGDDGLAAGDTNGIRTFAHETGHALGLAHAPACNAGSPDPKYPAYEPYDNAMAPRGLIGEYGFDIRTATIYQPQTTDIMGYCNPYWVSLYTHRFLTAHAKLVGGSTETRSRDDRRQLLVDPYRPKWANIPDPAPPWVDRGWTIKPRPIIFIAGTVRAGEIVDASVVRVEAVPLAEGDATPFTAVLTGVNGEHLASGRVMSLNLHPSGCGCGHQSNRSDEFAFQALLNNVAPGARLAIHRRDDKESKEIWFVEAPKRRPKLANLRVTRKKKEIELAWNCDPTDASVRFSVQFSKDGGVSWNATATLIDETRFAVQFERLPEGTVVFRVLAHDGFDTVYADSKRVEIPAVRPSLAILSPKQNEHLAANQPLLLWVGAIDQNGAPIADDTCRWEIDGKVIGVGQQVLIAAPSAGKHLARAVVSGRGGRAASEVAFATFAD